MSTPIFTITPREITRERIYAFDTLVTTLESGKEQRRSRRTFTRTRINFIFDPDALGADEFYDFFIARKGRYEAFYLPSFQRETTVRTNYTSGYELQIISNACFSGITNENGHLIHLKNAAGEEEIGIINYLSGNDIIMLQSPLTYDYVIGDYVQIAWKARFESDDLGMEFLDDWRRAVPISFLTLPE